MYPLAALAFPKLILLDGENRRNTKKKTVVLRHPKFFTTFDDFAYWRAMHTRKTLIKKKKYAY